MARNQFTFVNHAGFMVQNDSAVLLADPWVEGSAFNNGWSLLDRSTGNAALVAALNETALPVFIWISHEHPDHFSIGLIKLLKAEARVRITFLYQRTLDGRVVNFLRKQGFAVIECTPGVPVVLGHDMRIAVFPYSDGDSWALIQSGTRTMLNLNDCVVATPVQCRDIQAKVAALAPRIDVLLTQFFKSDAPWNESRYKSAKFDELLLASRAETDLAKRKQMYADMQLMIHNDAGLGIPMFLASIDGHSTKVKGLSPIPVGGLMGYMFGENVWLEA